MSILMRNLIGVAVSDPLNQYTLNQYIIYYNVIRKHFIDTYNLYYSVVQNIMFFNYSK